MRAPAIDTVKDRELLFSELHSDPNQAHSAAGLLESVTGVLHAHAVSQLRLQLRYDLNHITYRVVEEILVGTGFHLENSLLTKLRRALYYYTEDAQLENRGCQRGDSNCTVKVFVNRYDRLRHGCRDDRPPHWRRYL